MAGQLLNSLKSASTAASAISHEAKLGMAVITILFFAFCFLVYHKMDLHQRQLTQASIGSTAGTPDISATPEEPSGLMSGNVTGATTDPLLEKNPEATDNTMAATEQDLPAFGEAESNTTASNFGAPAAMEFAEPAEAETVVSEHRQGDLVADNAFPEAVIENRKMQDSSADQATAGNAFFAADEASRVPSLSTDPQVAAVDNAESELMTPEFSALEPTEEATRPHDNEFSSVLWRALRICQRQQRQPSIDVAETSEGIILPEAASAETADISCDST
ncbi:MAG: hypothetical protein U0936_02030 [Planctomycetaceae bacterium]